MSNRSSENSFSIIDEEDPSLQEETEEDMREERSEARTNEKEEVLKDKRRNLLCDLANKIYPPAFRSWPILNLLNPDFIMQIRMVMVFDDGNRALIVTKDKNVYISEYNKDDHLKTGNTYISFLETSEYNKDDHLKTGDTHIGFYPKKIKELCGKNIKTFACSLYFALALTEEGKVYSWRFKEQNRSDNTSNLSEMTPTQMLFDFGDKCIMSDIACGSDHFLAITNDGQVYAWGSNQFGQIGTKKLYYRTITFDNNNDKQCRFNQPRKVKHDLLKKKIATIACGSTFNMVITDQGKLYSWGKKFNWFDKSGRPIVGSLLDDCYPFPFQIIINEAIVKVACGFKHTLALTDEGKVYAWGSNAEGQVGVNKNIISPTLVDMPKLVKDIAAYGNLSVAVDSNKSIYVWGDCFGQKITTPLLTRFSTIHDAFAYTSMKAMHKPLFVADNEEDSLNIMESQGFGDLAMAFNDPEMSDFIVQVEDKCIYVHKLILNIRCQYFRDKFQHDQTKNDKRLQGTAEIYSVSDYSYIVYKAFLKYLYIGKVDLSTQNASDLMKLADEYGETNLKKECGRVIEQAITEFNVAFFYGKAIEYKAEELEDFCFKFALRHMKVVVLSNNYKMLDASIKDIFIQRAAEANVFQT